MVKTTMPHSIFLARCGIYADDHGILRPIVVVLPATRFVSLPTASLMSNRYSVGAEHQGLVVRRCALQELNRALRAPTAHHSGVIKAQRLQPGAVEELSVLAKPDTAMTTGVKVCLHISPALPALPLCRKFRI